MLGRFPSQRSSTVSVSVSETMTAGAIDHEGRPVIDPVNDMLKSRFTVRVFIAPHLRVMIERPQAESTPTQEWSWKAPSGQPPGVERELMRLASTTLGDDTLCVLAEETTDRVCDEQRFPAAAASPSPYVALLRGINVGGSNLIRMAALKSCFEAQGFRDVTTYIQSGNVLFTADRTSQHALTERIEAALSKAFAYESRVVVRSFEQMKVTVQKAPKGFGRQPAYRYDVIFLKEPLTSREALTSVSAKPGVDRVHAGAGVLYFARLISKAAQSHLSRVVGTPAYRNMTIRNWNTTTRLFDLMSVIRNARTSA